MYVSNSVITKTTTERLPYWILQCPHNTAVTISRQNASNYCYIGNLLLPPYLLNNTYYILYVVDIVEQFTKRVWLNYNKHIMFFHFYYWIVYPVKSAMTPIWLGIRYFKK